MDLLEIVHGQPSRDEMINWLEEQDRSIIFKVAESLNNCFDTPFWDDLNSEGDEEIVYLIEDSNCITREMLKIAIASCLGASRETRNKESKSRLWLVQE